MLLRFMLLDRNELRNERIGFSPVSLQFAKSNPEMPVATRITACTTAFTFVRNVCTCQI